MKRRITVETFLRRKRPSWGYQTRAQRFITTLVPLALILTLALVVAGVAAAAHYSGGGI